MAANRSTLDGMILAVVVAIVIVLATNGFGSDRDDGASSVTQSTQEQSQRQSANSDNGKGAGHVNESDPSVVQPPPRVNIRQMEPIEDEFFSDKETLKDVWGNAYDDYIVAAIWAMDDEKDRVWEEYAIGGQYNKFTGTLFMSGERPEAEQYQMKIYADGTELYSSPVIDKRSKPESVSVSIPENAEFLRIEFQMVNGSKSMLGGWYPECNAYLASGTLYRW